MKNTFFLLLILIFSSALLHGASYKVPVMVLPFENKTEVRQLDRFTSWLKAELKGYDNIRLIDFYKSTNVNGTLLLFMKPLQAIPFGKKNEAAANENLPDAYYIITGIITYTDYRYNIRAEVINSATEWVIAKDEVYISGVENVRTLLARELGKRLALKMNFKRVETFNEQKILNQATNTNQAGDISNQMNTVSGTTTPGEQQALYNEKKQVMIVFNTNEKKVIEALQKNNPTFRKPDDNQTVKLEERKQDVKFYVSPFEHEISFQPIISGDYRDTTNIIFTSYELAYKFQIVPTLFIGLNLGAGFFDVRRNDIDVLWDNTNENKNSIFEFRIMPSVLYRWYFIEPFFLDIQVGGGAFFGYDKYVLNKNEPIENGLNGFLVQAKGGVGIDIKRIVFGIYYMYEWQYVNYTDFNKSYQPSMFTISLTAGFKF